MIWTLTFAGILMVAGDTIAQFAVDRRRFAFPKNEAERSKCYDKSRTFRWAFFGTVMAVSSINNSHIVIF